MPQAVDVNDPSSLASFESEEPEDETVAIHEYPDCQAVAKQPAVFKAHSSPTKAVLKYKTPLVTSSSGRVR